MQYVTYDPLTGSLTGAYIQDLLPEHASIYIEVTDQDAYANWPAYQADAARDNIELIPFVPLAPYVPQVVPMLNARLALINAGLFAAANAYIDGMAGLDGDQARAQWGFSLVVRRDNSLVEQLRVAMSKTKEDIDALFVAAGTIST